MPTTKKRINISIGKSTREALKALARRDEVPVATAVAKLVEEALELNEDIVLGHIVHERLKKKAKWLSHREAWKHLTK